MSRIPRWKAEKAKVKVVFRLQFQATHVPQPGWDKLFVSFIPLDVGKIAAKTNKANVRNGNCKWADPIYETTRLLLDTRTKKYDEKLYKLVVSMGTSRSGLLGEVNINLADFADAQKPSSVALPLEGCGYGTVLQITVQLLTSKTGFREFEQQRETGSIGDKGHISINEMTEKIQGSPRAAIFLAEKSVSKKGKFKPDSTMLSSLQEVAEPSDDLEEATACFDCSSYTSESVNTEKSDIIGTPDSGGITSAVREQATWHQKALHPENPLLTGGSNDATQSWNSENKIGNGLTSISGRSDVQYEGLRMPSISEIWMEVSSLQKHADDLGEEIKTGLQLLSSEITSGESLVRDVSLLKSECLKIRSDMEALKHAREILNLNSIVADMSHKDVFLVPEQNRESMLKKVTDSSKYLCAAHTTNKCGQSVASIAEELEVRNEVDRNDSQMHVLQEKWMQDLSFVEDKVNKIHSKVKFQCNGVDVDVLSDFIDLEALLLNLKGTLISTDNAGFEKAAISNDAQGTHLQRMQTFLSEDHHEGDPGNVIEDRVCQLLTELETSRFEQESIMKKMGQMECYYEALIHELEVSHSSTSSELDSLKLEHSRCYHTISALQTQIEKMHQDMNDQFTRFGEDRENLDILNKELEKRAFTLEMMLKKLRWNYSIAVERLQKDLKLLSDQVLSLFETNENLVRQALVEASQLFCEESWEENSGSASPNKKLKWNGITSESNNIAVSIEPSVAEKLGQKDVCVSDLKIGMSSPHISSKKFDKVKDNSEVNSTSTQSSSTDNNRSLSLISSKHDQGLTEAFVRGMETPFDMHEEHYLTTEAELLNLHMGNVSLEIFSSILQEILREELCRIRYLEKEFNELSLKQCGSLKSNELLQMKVQNLTDNVNKLRDSEVRHIAECEGLALKNHILEAKLHDISEENSFLSNKVEDSQFLLKDLNELEMKYEVCNAARLGLENLLKEETANKSYLEKELTVTLEENEVIRLELSRCRDLIDDLQKMVSYANDKLGKLCLNFIHEDLLNKPAICNHPSEQDLVNRILHLEQLHVEINKVLFELRQSKKNLQEEGIIMQDLVRVKDSSLFELTAKYNSSNALVEDLQLKLKHVAEDLSSCLEARKSLSEENKDLLVKLAGMELELQVVVSEKSHLVEKLCEFDDIVDELRMMTLAYESCMHEKQSLELSILSGNEKNTQLDSEVCSLNEKLASANNEIFRGVDLIEKISNTVSDFTASVVEKQVYIDELLSQTTDLKSQIGGLVSNNFKLQNLIIENEDWKKKIEDEKISLSAQVLDLETELIKCKECLRSLDFGLQAERACKEKLECKVTDLTWQLENQSEHLINFEEQKAELTHLNHQLFELETEKVKLRSVLSEVEEDRKNFNHVIMLLRSQVSTLENELSNAKESLVAVHDELHVERTMGDKLNAIIRSLENEICQKDIQIKRSKDLEPKLDDIVRNFASTFIEKDLVIYDKELEILNIRQELSDVVSRKNELHHLFVKCEESQKKIEDENFALRAQISDLETAWHELKECHISTNSDLQSERDWKEKLQFKVSELTLVLDEKSQQSIDFESQKTDFIHLTQQLLDVESEKTKLLNVLSKNREHCENLNHEIDVLHCKVAGLENDLINANKSSNIACDQLHVEKGLREKFEGLVMSLQSELDEKEKQIFSLMKQQQDHEDAYLQIQHLEAENSEHRILLLKENERKSKLIFENSSLLIRIADMETQSKEMMEVLLSSDLKVTFMRNQFLAAFELVLDQLHALDGCYKELQLKYQDARSRQKLLVSGEYKCMEEKERLTSDLLDLKSYDHIVVNEKTNLETHDKNVIQPKLVSSLIEHESMLCPSEEIKQLRILQKVFEEETDSLISARDELDITISVLRCKLDEQSHHLSMLKEYDAEMMRMQEQQNELTYRLSEQILKAEEFKNLSIHLKELNDKAVAEHMHTQDKKEIEGPSVAVQESLRMAFVKEQCETKVQEMKNQLSTSKKYGEELLVKLQIAVDEVEFRKKSEVSHLKKIEDLLVKLTELEDDLKRVSYEREGLQNSCDRMKVELDHCNSSLDSCRDEKLKLEVSLRECNEDRTKSRVELDLVRRRLQILSSSVEIFDKNDETGTSNVTSFEKLLEGNKIGLSPVLQQSPAVRSISNGKDTSDIFGTGDAKEQDDLMETQYELNSVEDKSLPCKQLAQDVFEKGEEFQISGPGSVEQAIMPQYDADFKELIKERENLQSSLEILQKELETLKSENLVCQVPFDGYHIDPNLCGLQLELTRLDMANEHLENVFPLFKEFSVSGNALENVLALELEFAKALQEKKKDFYFLSSSLEHYDKEESILKSFKDINEVIKEMLLLKGRYVSVENELKEMQARYSQLSLQFAEVEGERQKLMMTLKNRTPKKH